MTVVADQVGLAVVTGSVESSVAAVAAVAVACVVDSGI